MRQIRGYLFIVLMIFTGTGCKVNADKSATDSPLKGAINISVDESFEPVIAAQIKVYEASFPGTHINAEYKPEADCFKDFFRDSSNRMMIVTRGLTDKEERSMMNLLHFRPGWGKIATDAITLIVNVNNPDTLFTLSRLQQQLLGKINRNQVIVFDGLNATSTVRYISDSILNGQQFDSSVVKAAENTEQVIDYVSKNENAIGVIGISWIGNPEEETQVNLLKKVRIAYIQCDPCVGKPFVKPMQASILTRRYPLVRGLYYAIKENYFGLGSGFVNFLKYERGQLIFRRAYLGPTMDFDIRKVKITKNL